MTEYLNLSFEIGDDVDVVSDNITTEDDESLLTEDGDFLVLED